MYNYVYQLFFYYKLLFILISLLCLHIQVHLPYLTRNTYLCLPLVNMYTSVNALDILYYYTKYIKRQTILHMNMLFSSLYCRMQQNYICLFDLKKYDSCRLNQDLLLFSQILFITLLFVFGLTSFPISNDRHPCFNRKIIEIFSCEILLLEVEKYQCQKKTI